MTSRILNKTNSYSLLLLLGSILFSSYSLAVLDPKSSENPSIYKYTNIANAYLTEAINEEKNNGLNVKAVKLYKASGAIFLKIRHCSEAIPPLSKYHKYYESREPENIDVHASLYMNFIDCLISEGEIRLAEKSLDDFKGILKNDFSSRNIAKFSHSLFTAKLSMLNGQKIKYANLIDELISKIFTLNNREYWTASKKLKQFLLESGDLQKFLEYRRFAHQWNTRNIESSKNIRYKNIVEEIQLLKLMHQLNEARKIIEDTISEEDVPKQYQVILLEALGDIQIESGNYRGAIETYQYLSSMEKSGHIDKDYGLLMGIAYAKLGKIEKAEKEFEKSLRDFEAFNKNQRKFISIKENIARAGMETSIAKLAAELGYIETARKYNNKTRAFFDSIKFLGDKRSVTNNQILLEIANKSNHIEDWIEAEKNIYPLFLNGINSNYLFLKEHQDLIIKSYSILSSLNNKYKERALIVLEQLTSKKIEDNIKSSYLRSEVSNEEISQLIHQRDYLIQKLRYSHNSADVIRKTYSRVKKITNDLSSYPEIDKLIFTTNNNSLASVQDRLSSSTAIIKFVSTSESYYAFLIRKNSASFIDLKAKPQKVLKLIQKLRESIEPIGNGIIPEYDYLSANNLYNTLLLPLRPQLTGTDKLHIVPEDYTLSIPFPALITNKKENSSWLFKEFKVSIIPSISSLHFLRSNDKVAFKKKFLGVGDPSFIRSNENKLSGESSKLRQINDRRPLISLPNTRKEIVSIAEFFGEAESDLLLGKEANEKNILDMKSLDYQYINFATHGLLSNENEHLEPGLALSYPLSDSGNFDGILSSSEIMRLNINSDLVFLSACNTAGSKDIGQFQGLAGLTSSFLFAGARSVVVSNWAVDSDSAAYITTQTVKHITNNGLEPTTSINLVISSILKDKTLEHWHHPFYWSPFFVVGIN